MEADQVQVPDAPAERVRKPKATLQTMINDKKAKTPAKKAAKKVATKSKAPKGEGKVPIAQALAAHRPNYEKGKLEDGRSFIDNGDEAAQTLRGSTLDEVYALVAKHMGVTQKDLKAKYAHLNLGQQRMNLGNRFRRILREQASAGK